MAKSVPKLSPLYVLGIGVGALLVYGAVKDTNPLQTLKAVITGEPPPAAGSWAPEGYGTTFAGSDTGAGLALGGEAIGGKGSGKVVWPTTSHQLGPRFGAKGSVWSSGYHDGQDIDGACGDPIFSPVDGKVVSAGYAGAYGNRVVVQAYGLSNTQFWLCHLSTFTVRPGQTVSAGSRVGRMGQTGNAYGCHLHVTVEKNGTKVDPMNYL